MSDENEQLKKEIYQNSTYAQIMEYDAPQQYNYVAL